MKNTVVVKKDDNDKFYTRIDLAKKYLSIIKEKVCSVTLWIEPSAGDGSFYKILPANKKGYDLYPEFDGVIQQDFLTTDDSTPDQKIVYVGNPPFGTSANLAIKFFNHCASNKNASHIAFVVPKTFKKISVHNKLSMDFGVIYEEDLPDKSFVLNGEPYDVPCVFQIWERLKVQREKIKPPRNKWFELVSPSDAEFCVRRVGGRAGQVLDGLDHSKTSTYFIKPKVKGLKETIASLDFDPYVNATVGVRSLSITEILIELDKLN